MTIYFLGAGNMAYAIIAGMSRAGGFDICAIDYSADKLATLAQQYGIATAAELPPLKEGDVLVLAVKPQDMQAALQKVQTGGALVLSIAAGLPCAALSRWLGGTRRIVRIMPNTPAQVVPTGNWPTASCAPAGKLSGWIVKTACTASPVSAAAARPMCSTCLKRCKTLQGSRVSMRKKRGSSVWPPSKARCG